MEYTIKASCHPYHTVQKTRQLIFLRDEAKKRIKMNGEKNAGNNTETGSEYHGLGNRHSRESLQAF